MEVKMSKKILVIGGAGYVGSALVPKLLDAGHYVRVLDTFWFGDGVFNDWILKNSRTSINRLGFVKGDIRNCDLEQAMRDVDCVIHLACISNDPSFELNRDLGRSINYDAFLKVIIAAQESKIGRFIFASSSSVYGVKNTPNVTEDMCLEPLTDYSKYKAFCEMELQMIPTEKLPWVIIRPATVCGYAPRMRLDLSVNILTMAALTKGKIMVFGGSQIRPNIHIEDMTDLYVRLVNEEDDRIIGRTFNAGGSNLSIETIAELVKKIIEQCMAKKIEIEKVPTWDLRSYHVSSAKIERQLGWQTIRDVPDAVVHLMKAFNAGLIPNPDDPKYSNIKTMKVLKIQ
ncbi:NAD-dependent epimerase/dehydratase [Patescibacteria group bacterium]|nr:NAD-dependent epimerase/dehydratase [Patescibacteria group bacterium]